MQIADILIESIRCPDWNPNQMDPTTRGRLIHSLNRFGLVVPLVVRSISDGHYETISGAQRLEVLRELGADTVSCVVVEANDSNARLLAQALNRIQGEDDLGLRAELLKEVLEEIPEAEVLNLLPESAEGLSAFASLGQQDLAGYLQNWQQAQGARLKHLTFQFTPAQLEIIEAALSQVVVQAKGTSTDNPNPRGNALYLLCKSYLELVGRES